MAEYACTRCGHADMPGLGLSRVCLDADACHQRQYGQLRDRAERAEAKVDEIRRTIAAFLGHHGNSAAFALQSARDLAEGIRQILDRAPLEALGGAEKPS